MDLGLKGKVAVVTASSKGLGYAIAKELASEGANLVLCSRSKERIDTVAEQLEQTYGVRTLALQADVSQPEHIAELVDKALQVFGQVDALVCNAGGPPSGSFLSIQDDDWERSFQANLMSVVRLIRGFYPAMERNGGRIITIASSSVKMPIPGLILSNTFRTAITGLMKTLSIELAPQGILLNTVCPGRISTDRLAELDSQRAEREGVSIEDIRTSIQQDIPLGRYGTPEEFAELATFLLSDRNTYMTGSVFHVDGGMVKAL